MSDEFNSLAYDDFKDLGLENMSFEELMDFGFDDPDVLYSVTGIDKYCEFDGYSDSLGFDEDC